MIIDCFPFFDELDLLEVRLNELKDVVDVFALSEATLTFSNNPKPLYYEENKDRFKGFSITHTIIDNYDTIDTSDQKLMDRGQKQAGIDAVMNDIFIPGDTLILSDLDEIPKASSVKDALDDDWKVAALEMPLFYYYMNCRRVGNVRGFGVQNKARMLRPNKPFRLCRIRDRKINRHGKYYADAGWHFSFLGDIQYKLQSWTHESDYNNPEYNTIEHIEHCKATGEDLFGRRKYQFEFVNDLNYLPQYVLDNMDKFGKHICQN
jgi:hypothetical protein